MLRILFSGQRPISSSARSSSESASLPPSSSRLSRSFALPLTLSLSLAVSLPAVLQAGKYNPTLSPGDSAPSWEKLPAVDGKAYSLADFNDKSIVVITFTCNSCPTAVDYEARILALSKSLAKQNGILIAISSNDTTRAPEDGIDGMKAKAEKQKFDFPYLRDDGQKVARAYGATFTPEFFVLNKDRKIVYMGALDDTSPPAAAKIHFVEEAIAAALAGKSPATAETVARGCTVRYERVRRTKP